MKFRRVDAMYGRFGEDSEKLLKLIEVAEVDVISRNRCKFRRDGATCATTARDAHTAGRDRCSAGRAMHSSVCLAISGTHGVVGAGVG